MPVFEYKEEGLFEVEQTTFKARAIDERYGLQSRIARHPQVLGEELFIIAEEYSDWEDSKRRVDLLALDEDGSLVVIELKRTEDGGHMDLQALRYAAMVASMTFEDVVAAHIKYRNAKQPGSVTAREVEQALRAFLELEGTTPVVIGAVPRVLLVSHSFSREITTTVLWLIERGIDIRCIEMLPYLVADKTLISVRRVIPLEQVRDYQVKLRKKAEVEQEVASRERSEETMKVLARSGLIREGTVLELMPEFRPEGVHSPALFRASVAADGRRFVWEQDGEPYAATALTTLLRERIALPRTGKTFSCWRIEGHERSMWDEASSLRGT